MVRRVTGILCIVCFAFFSLILPGCSFDKTESDKSLSESSTMAETQGDSGIHPLKGKNINMTILGISGWVPSKIAGDMASEFTKYAKDKYGYNAAFNYSDAPFGNLYNIAAKSLAERSNKYNIIVSDSQWLGAFAEPGWIVQLNDIINNNPELKNVEWYDPVVKSGYMAYPDGTNDLWGLPQEGDVIVLYVRKDMLQDPAERNAFRERYNSDLPQNYEDFVSLSIDEFEKMAEFFTRPDKGLYGTALEYSREYDYMSGYLYPFIWSTGGEIWDAGSGKIFGILNTSNNARALERMVNLLKFNPPGAINYGIDEVVDAFAKGKVFSAFQWAAMGQAIITPELRDKVLVVPPPGFKTNNGNERVYSLGGQPWVINKFNDEDQMKVAIDFLKWWYLPETQIEFMRRGGNPTTRAALESPEFENTNPWNKAYKYMFTQKRARDFWHDPKYSELLAVQQSAFTGYATGVIKNAKEALDFAAYQQQKILYESGRTDIAPPDIDLKTLQNQEVK